MVKHKKQCNNELDKWWLLQPRGAELKKLIENLRRRKLRTLVEWNGGKVYRRRRRQ